MLIFILILNLFFSSQVQAYIYYQKQDQQNHIFFSDQPSENAKLMQLKSINIYLAPSTTPSDEKNSENPSNTYTEFSIAQPAQQQTFQNQTDIAVKLNITPKLKKDHKISLWLDGKELQTITTNDAILHQIDRGAHQLQAKLITQTNEELATTDIVMFYVHSGDARRKGGER